MVKNGVIAVLDIGSTWVRAFICERDEDGILKILGVGTKTTTGLSVICVRDDTEYELKRTVSDDEFESIILIDIPPFATWNYRILPHSFVQFIF